MTASLEVRVRDYLARNGTDVSLTQVAVHLGERRRDVAAIIGRLDLDRPTHVEPEDIQPPTGPTLTFEETAAPKPRRIMPRKGRGTLTARGATGRRSDCPCEGLQCRIDEGDHRHGTGNGYGNHRCRCRPCRDAVAAQQRDRKARLARQMSCPNCSGPGGPYRDGTCTACDRYERRTGVPRPPELYDRQPRTCSNCAAEMPDGKPRRQGRCQACARYFERTGRERPERLWRHNVGRPLPGRHGGEPDSEPVGTRHEARCTSRPSGLSAGVPSPTATHHTPSGGAA